MSTHNICSCAEISKKYQYFFYKKSIFSKALYIYFKVTLISMWNQMILKHNNFTTVFILNIWTVNLLTILILIFEQFQFYYLLMCLKLLDE